MKRFLFIFLFHIPLSLFAVNDTTYLKKIENAQTKIEKETSYIEWLSALSQHNTFHCDSIFKTRNNYIKEFSDDGNLTLLLIYLNNSRFGGSMVTPKIEEFNLSEQDLILTQGLIRCFKGEVISDEDFKKINKYVNNYSDPTRSCVYYAIATCVEGTTKEKKINHFNTALKHATRSHLKGIFSSVLDVLSSYFLEIEDFEQAILHQQKGIAYAKKHNLKVNLINHLINIGRIHLELGDFNKSEKALHEALELSADLKLDFIQGQLYNRLGELYSIQKQFDKGILYYRQSLLKFYNINNAHGLATAHKNIGKAYFRNGDIDLAEKNYKLSEEFFNQLGESNSKGELYYSMSELYLRTNNLSLAEINILKAINHWHESELLIPLHEAYLLYANIKRKQGSHKVAYDYLQRYLNFQDSFHELETRKKVAELSEMFKSEQNERKITEQEKKIEEEFTHRLLIQNKLESSKQQTRLIIIILIISLILFVAIFIIIRNRNRQEQLIKKQREIELQQTLLRTQMNPHFIFNAMSVIQSYIYDEDIANSSKFLIHFSKLMRMILENNAKQFIPLETELEIINRYLVLQKMRFEDRFDFEIIEDEIDDPTSISIPPMLVQPFIENSIEHGDLDQVGNGLIRVYCEIKEDLFIFTVEDNGIGRQKALQNKKAETSENHRSMAIELTESRIILLNEKYKSKGFLLIEDSNPIQGTGTKVTIAIPFIKNF